MNIIKNYIIPGAILTATLGLLGYIVCYCRRRYCSDKEICINKKEEKTEDN